MLRLCKGCEQKVCAAMKYVTGRLLESRVIILSQAHHCAHPTGWGLNMRSHITPFTIRMIVAFGIALVGTSAFGIVVATRHSSEPR